ncbi:prepilin-type N-terminal cleavage/methylation domain-containing protein [Desulfobotulus alkaliphilus]|uniref:Prepilin-type N-terminal cleavage/methylation domain-containing protein n=1 Tax=Desulfobotulus alkaliphilus TaxID=622671 RepID=A0A562S5Y8_9BACT|nr:type II secretion system protein [Desulfobotulus alkaliphilus]TWI76717.1 prepilin-type N-terminal cleavage/methylation domain-containing protein [Desulfobotulus alkaliphilus]
MLKMFKKRNRQLNQKGFTLLEILVVVAIMGFLVAMVAPRFAGIVGNTEELVCDTNQQRMVAAVATYYETKGGLPSGLVNLVDQNTEDDSYQIPTHTGQLEFSDEGKATFDDEFIDRNLFAVHHLSGAEANRIRRLGIGSVYNLNAYNYEGIDEDEYDFIDSDDRAAPLNRARVAEGLGVLMVGMGASDQDAYLAFSPSVSRNTTTGILEFGGEGYAEWGNPEWLGRIFFGVGADSALVKEGMLSAAGLCPEGLNDDQITWNHYGILLPRLKETVDRMTDEFRGDLEQVIAKANGGAYRTFNLAKAQQGFEFVTQCPEGHMYPESEDFEEWAIAVGVTDEEDAKTALDAVMD